MWWLQSNIWLDQLRSNGPLPNIDLCLHSIWYMNYIAYILREQYKNVINREDCTEWKKKVYMIIPNASVKSSQLFETDPCYLKVFVVKMYANVIQRMNGKIDGPNNRLNLHKSIECTGTTAAKRPCIQKQVNMYGEIEKWKTFSDCNTKRIEKMVVSLHRLSFLELNHLGGERVDPFNIIAQFDEPLFSFHFDTNRQYL